MFLSYLYLYFSEYYHSLQNNLLVTQNLRLERLFTVQCTNLNNKLFVSHQKLQATNNLGFFYNCEITLENFTYSEIINTQIS
jgi:hypothetical protein